ncbi:ribonuclease YeeF family protein [Sutcliffiella horikoshii]|uniref:ribonuclease YeeF family protein n=1 Tax=Sutcliffiella horikoshii TaxID=79883 RepID=UPI003850B960
MKTLEISTLQSGVEQLLAKLSQHREQVSQLESAVQNFSSLDESFKGQAGQSIRGFYQDSHQPFLQFFKEVIEMYESALNGLKNELNGVEPASNGVIKEDFLQHDIEQGLNQARDFVMDLADETNQKVQSISDIVSLPRIQDASFQGEVQAARQHVDQTIEKLHRFDQTQTSTLDPVEQGLQFMNQYVQQVQGLFSSGSVSIDSYNPNFCYAPEYLQNGGNRDPYYGFSTDPRVVANGVDASDTGRDVPFEWDMTPTLGLNFDQWIEKPINAATNLVMTTSAAYDASKNVYKARQGFGVQRSYYVTAQGETRVRVTVDKPELYGLDKKTYSGHNATNNPRLFKLVDATTNVKESFKWAGNKISYIGIGTTIAGDIVHGVQNNQSGSEIAGNVTGDVVIAGASIAASAAAGAKVGAMMGVAGGPVGFAVGTVVGAAVGLFVSSALDDYKFMDFDKDGENDSIGDAIKKGTTGIINKIGSWFGK